MADSARKELEKLLQLPGNETCADCHSEDPDWASYNLGVFLCTDCAGVHRSLGAHISKVKSIKLDNWEEGQLGQMQTVGNAKATELYEYHVPACFRRPSKDSAQVLKEQWIRAKYERSEFTDIHKQGYLTGVKEGYLWKRGKDDRQFKKRQFKLNQEENYLKYFTKDDAKSPKATLRLDDINVAMVPEKIGNPNGLQVTFVQDGHTRSLFVYAEEGKDLIDWYTAIRQARLYRLQIAFPFASIDELLPTLTRDFIKEGWMHKMGPNQNDAFRKRFFTLDQRKLMYYGDPMDAYPKGEIILGLQDKGFVVCSRLAPGLKDPFYGFTVKTPSREFHFSAEEEEEKEAWISALKGVISKPMTPQESASMSKRP